MTSTKTPPYSGSRAKRQEVPLVSQTPKLLLTNEHQGSSQVWRYSIEYTSILVVPYGSSAKNGKGVEALLQLFSCTKNCIKYDILRQLHIISGICCSYKHKSGRHSSSQLIKQLIILSCMVIIYCRKIYSKIVEEFMKSGTLVAAFICL